MTSKTTEEWIAEFYRIFDTENIWQGEDEWTKNVPIGNMEEWLRTLITTLRKEQEDKEQKLQDEYGLVWSDTDQRFLPMYRGILGMDDFVEARFKGKLLDIRKDVEAQKRALYPVGSFLDHRTEHNEIWNKATDNFLEIIDKELGEDFIKERGNEK